MENEKKIRQARVGQEESRSLNTTYKFMLCVFFCYLFRISIGGVSQIRKAIIPEILQSDTPILSSLFYLDWALWILFGFWAIILALKGSKSAIPCLKLCLSFHFVALLLNGVTRISSFSFGVLWLPFLILAFPLIFFIYLCASDTIKREYPKNERRLGFPGTIGILLYVLLGLLLAQAIGASIKKGINGKKVDPNRIELHDNEMTDGRAIFIPKETWQLDSTTTPLSIEEVFWFRDTVSKSIALVSCTTEEYEPSRHFYIYSITEHQPFDPLLFKGEVGHEQYETDDAVVFIDQYQYQMDSTLYYWTYASRLGKKVEKGVRLSIVERDSLRTTIADAVEFLNNTTFDVRSRLLKKD